MVFEAEFEASDCFKWDVCNYRGRSVESCTVSIKSPLLDCMQTRCKLLSASRLYCSAGSAALIDALAGFDPDTCYIRYHSLQPLSNTGRMATVKELHHSPHEAREALDHVDDALLRVRDAAPLSPNYPEAFRAGGSR